MFCNLCFVSTRQILLQFFSVRFAQFFMKATQLEQMREDFVYIKTTKHVTEDKASQHSEVRICFLNLCDIFIFNYIHGRLHSLWIGVRYYSYPSSFNTHMFLWLFQSLKDTKRRYLEKEDRYKSLASLDEMRTKLEELQKQMAWALVRSFSQKKTNFEL